MDARGKWYVRSKSYYSFGTTLHGVLQRFHDEGDQGVKTVDEAMAALEESWIEAGYQSQDEMMLALAEGKRMVGAYVERVKRAAVTTRTMFVEKLLRKDLGDFVLLGRVDRVDEHEDGRLEVIDYKSGRETVGEDDVRYDLAMGCYQLLLSHAFPEREVFCTVVALRTGIRASAAMSGEELTEFERDLQKLGGIVLGMEWGEDLPVWKERLCPTCDFLPLCGKAEGFLPEARLPGGFAGDSEGE